MAFPTDPVDVEVGLWIDGAWVDAISTGDGVRLDSPITITRGRADWSARAETGRATWTLDNRDGRWSRDNPTGPYFGNLKRNIPARIGIGTGDPHLAYNGTSADVISTPDIPGTGGGSPTAPNVVDVTESSETAYTTTHTFDLPATVAAGNRLLLVAAIGHNSATPSGGTLDDWDLVFSSDLHTYHRWVMYETYVEDGTRATALSGGTVTFATTSANKSSCQVIRVNGARSGGSGSAYSVSAGVTNTYSANPNPDSLTTGWGADENLFLALFTSGAEPDGTGAVVTANPTGYTAQGDGDDGAVFVVGVASKTSSSATDDPAAFTLTDTASWEAATFAYRAEEDTSSDGVLDITGDIDVRFEFQLFEDPIDINDGGERFRIAHKSSGANGWEVELFGLDDRVVVNFSWKDSGGTARNYSSDQTGGSYPVTFFHDRVAARFELDVSTGSGSFYHSTAIDGTWTQVGSAVATVGATSIKSNDAPLRLAGNPADGAVVPLPGRLFAFELRDGGAAGTLVADPDFTGETVGASGFTDNAGRVWTLGAGGEITDKRWRFHGEMSSLPVRWDTQGRDVIAPVEAAGLFRRLRQGNRRLQSPLRRAIISSATNLIQYWPMEETGPGITRFGAAVGTAPMIVNNGVPNAGSNSDFVSSEAISTLGDANCSANVDAYTGTQAFQIRWLQSIPDTFTGTDLQYFFVTTTDILWIIAYRDANGGDLQVLGFRGGTLVYQSAWLSIECTGEAFRMTFAIVQNGSNVDVNLEGQRETDPSAGGFYISNAVAGSAGQVTQIRVNRNANIGDWGIGHITLQNAKTPSTELSDELNAFDGEKAGDRIRRLCREEGIKARIEGDAIDTEIMGPQQANTLMALLEECADTDLGILHEARDTVAVAYRTRQSMIDQGAASTISLDYANGEVADSLEPDRDDQGFYNDVTVTNWTGATARAVLDDGSDLSVSEPPVGTGRYDNTYSVNSQDARLQELADTRLALGSVDEPRISRLPLALHHPALVADSALTGQILDASLGDKVEVANNLAGALGTATVSQLAQGIREQIGNQTWTLDVLTSPSSPWDTGAIIDPPTAHSVTFRTQQDLAYPGSPQHVLTALGYTDTAKITRADLDGILDDWVASTGGTTRNVTSAATWTTALAAAQPGDLVRITSTITGSPLNARASKFSLSGSNMIDGQPGLPIILTCADGVYNDPNNTSNGDVGLDLQNCSHVWAVGFNVRNSQFGIRGQNWSGSAGFPAYIAYCSAENLGHNGIQVQGWFQALTSSGGTVPTETEIASPGLDWGYSEFFVVEENTVDGTGVIADEFGEAFYFGTGTGGGGWHGFCRDFWVRGNHATDWTSDAYDVKPGCYRGRLTDNEYYVGHAVSGAPFQMCLVVAANSSRPSWFDFDPELYVEGNRGWDSNLTNTNGSSDNIMGYVGLSGIRIANCITWAHPQTGTHSMWRFRNQKGTNDTEAETEFRTDPTWVVNCTAWGDDSVELAGYGASPTAFPSAILAVIDLRNNIVDQASPADGEVDASASDFIATVPAIGVAGDAEWLTYGNGSAFDLALTSALIGTGESIADIPLLIEQDISGRDIPATNPNPGAFQPHPANT